MADDQEAFERSSEAERKELLHRIWVAQAKALVAALETNEPGKVQAATLTAARQFLSDNGTRSDTLDNPAGDVDPATEELVATLKKLNIEDGALPEAPAGEDCPTRLEEQEGN